MDKGKYHILIADDNPDILRLIEINLKFEGYNVFTASDGNKALQIACQKLPDLIILDVLMPVMDGWQTLAHLKSRSETENIPVILLTGVSMKEGKERGLIEGVEDYLSKPFNPLRLIEVVDDVLFRKKSADIKTPLAASRKIQVGLIGEGDRGLKLMLTLTGSASIQLTAFCGIGDEFPVFDLLREQNVTIEETPENLLENNDIQLIIDSRQNRDEVFIEKAGKKGITILQGLSIELIQKILEDYKFSRTKEKSLIKELNTRVKELSILNEMSQILTSPLDQWLLMDKISALALKISKADSCAVFLYDEDHEKFTISNIRGLSEDFKDKVKLSLSSSIIEEITALRRPLVLPHIVEQGVSSFFDEIKREKKESMVAVPLFLKDKLIGIIAVFSSEPRDYSKEIVNLLAILARQAGISIENAQLYKYTRKKQLLVEKLLSKLIQAQEEERKRIAAEIHDTIAQSLVSILTKVQTCQSLIKKDPKKIAQKLEELKALAAENVQEVRQIIFDLRPSSLDDLGLIPSLENYIKRFERDNKITVEFIVNNRNRRLPTTVETAVFRLTQEALTNIKKHSKADSVLIRLNLDPKMVNLRVSDNGEGFDWEKVTKRFILGDTHGLQGMKERVSLLGGTFKVTTGKGKGCCVNAQIPLNKENNESLIDAVKFLYKNYNVNNDKTFFQSP